MSEVNLHTLHPVLGAKMIKLSTLAREIGNIKNIFNTTPMLKDKVIFTELETRTNLIQQRIGHMIAKVCELLPVINSLDHPSDDWPVVHNTMEHINQEMGLQISFENLEKEVDVEYNELSSIKQLYLSLSAQVINELSTAISLLVKQQIRLIDA